MPSKEKVKTEKGRRDSRLRTWPKKTPHQGGKNWQGADLPNPGVKFSRETLNKRSLLDSDVITSQYNYSLSLTGTGHKPT